MRRRHTAKIHSFCRMRRLIGEERSRMFLDYNLQYELLNEHRYRLATEAEQAKMRKSSTNQPLRIWRYVADLLPHVIGGEESEGERCRVVPAAGVVE